MPIPNAIDILRLTAGLGCDGDTIAMAPATQPGIEGLVLGAIPWLPKVNVRNPFLAMENGDEFPGFFHCPEQGQENPLVMENSRDSITFAKRGWPVTASDSRFPETRASQDFK